MIIITYFKKRKKYLLKIQNFYSEINSFENQYISKKYEKILIRKYKPIYLYFKYKLKSNRIKKFMKLYCNLEQYFQTQNSIYLKNELLMHEDLLNNIDGKSLDFQQKQAVISDEKNNLIIAGAGSGKTLTISGKVKYLIESRKSKT